MLKHPQNRFQAIFRELIDGGFEFIAGGHDGCQNAPILREIWRSACTLPA
jgi:hypothetical protein